MINERVLQLEENAKKYNYYQQTLNIEQSRFEDLEDLRNDLNMRLNVWCSLEEWQLATSQWVDTQFSAIDADVIRTRCDHYIKVPTNICRSSPSA